MFQVQERVSRLNPNVGICWWCSLSAVVTDAAGDTVCFLCARRPGDRNLEQTRALWQQGHAVINEEVAALVRVIGPRLPFPQSTHRERQRMS